MTIFVFMLMWTFIFYVIFIQIREYNELVYTEYCFKYFDLRDRLAMLVVRGKIKEESWEYKHIVDLINFHISAIEEISITRIAAMLIGYHSKKSNAEVETIRMHTTDKEIASIMIDYLSVSHDLICRNSRAQMVILALTKWILDRFGVRNDRKHIIVANPKEALCRINSEKLRFEAVAA